MSESGAMGIHGCLLHYSYFFVVVEILKLSTEKVEEEEKNQTLSSQVDLNFKKQSRDFLVGQRRIRLPRRGTQVRSLVGRFHMPRSN